MKKGSAHHGDIAVRNVYALNNITGKWREAKPDELKGEIDKPTVILETLIALSQLIEWDRKWARW